MTSYCLEWLADAIDDPLTSFVQACLKFGRSVLGFPRDSLIWISRRPRPTVASGLQGGSTNDVYSSAEYADPMEDIEKSTILRVGSHPPAMSRSGPNRKEGLLRPTLGDAFDFVQGGLDSPRIDAGNGPMGPVSPSRAPLPPSPAPQIRLCRMASRPVSRFEPVNVIEQPSAETGPSDLDVLIALDSLQVSQTLPMHTAILRDVQFSPDGIYRRLSPTCVLDEVLSVNLS